jgi:hypothetical protein
MAFKHYMHKITTIVSVSLFILTMVCSCKSSPTTQGNYTTANVSSAMPLTLFYPSELHGCPFILSGINSYVFQPLNDVAAIYQISNIEPFIEKINKEVQTTGLTDADPGVYSVVAGDEWGDLVIVHFTVSNMAGTTTSTNTPE